MVFPPDLWAQLDSLTEALDGSGDDLAAILGVLADDLRAGIDSFVGLSVTVLAGRKPITVTAMSSDSAATSMLLPLGAATPGADHIVFYAQNPGAFTDLAAAARAVPGTGTGIVVDGHLPPPTMSAARRGLADLADRSSIDQALGFLIAQGHPPAGAEAELARRAVAAGTSMARIAEQILQPAAPPGPGDQT